MSGKLCQKACDLMATKVPILLIPLVSAIIWIWVVGLHLSSMEWQILGRLLIFGFPMVLLICYGYMSADKYASAIAGLLLFPLMLTYVEMLQTGTGNVLQFSRLLNLITGLTPLILIAGLAGYLASKKTKIHILGSVALLILVLAIIVGID